MKWYAKDVSGGQALVIDEDTGRSVAVAYDKKDAALLAAAPRMKHVLMEALNFCEKKPMGQTMEEKKKDYHLLKMGLRELVVDALRAAGVQP